MKNLPVLPTPLIFEILIFDQGTDCLQWYGQDSAGNKTSEQFLFPMLTPEKSSIHLIHPRFWRIAYIGKMSEWRRRDEFVKTSDDPIVACLQANECFRLNATEECVASLVLLANDGGRLIYPASYEDENILASLPRNDDDKCRQEVIRECYLLRCDDTSGSSENEIDLCVEIKKAVRLYHQEIADN